MARELQDEVAAVAQNNVIMSSGRSSRSKAPVKDTKPSMKAQIAANKVCPCPCNHCYIIS